jgi:acyl-CoA reductase-like NAD-dependent aldehyde dehydrogenase
MLRLKDGVEIYSVPGEESRYFYQPMGVGVVIAPWNFPTAILTGMSSAAVVTGNTIIMKPLEFKRSRQSLPDVNAEEVRRGRSCCADIRAILTPL